MSVTPEHIRESNLIEGIDNPTADAVGHAAWHWLRAQERITPYVVRQLHHITTSAQRSLNPDERGAWRRCPVFVGGHEGAAWADIPELMALWCEFGLDAPPRVSHVDFERIHPFIDGNGRVGRLLMWWHQTQLGERPSLLRASERHDYYRWFTPGSEGTST